MQRKTHIKKIKRNLRSVLLVDVEFSNDLRIVASLFYFIAVCVWFYCTSLFIYLFAFYIFSGVYGGEGRRQIPSHFLESVSSHTSLSDMAGLYPNGVSSLFNYDCFT